KMDRKSGVLQVHNVYMEDGAPEDAATANAIGEQIKGLARFLGATAVQFGTVPAAWEGITAVANG
ncbi:MAG: hypothetical protein GY943_11175, partial [Chloroflexi bacterium]|nr:hypothetical protein [Chloroflexota bacterium]